MISIEKTHINGQFLLPTCFILQLRPQKIAFNPICHWDWAILADKQTQNLVVGAFGEGSEDLHTLIHHLATSRVRVAGPQKGKRGQVRSEEAELAITTSFLRRTLSLAGVRAQSKLLLSRLEVIGPVAGANAAAGRRSNALNLERRMANQRRADQLSRMQGKALLRRGQFKIDWFNQLLKQKHSQL